jgi:hypothetical protein
MASPDKEKWEFRIGMTMCILPRWTMELVNVEGAFLNGTFEPQH